MTRCSLLELNETRKESERETIKEERKKQRKADACKQQNLLSNMITQHELGFTLN